ncbi:MAG: cytochrome c oxidase assembly protein subunit 15 [Flavobacteriales bacterium]|jgi:cytochrome c oxidase assembly protein subunit 15
MFAPIHRFAQASLIFVFIVIIAGSVVRMTGSGMGCPDWPKCFGYYIPPTDSEQVTWATDKSFEEGQMVVYQESLWQAKSNFKTGSQIDLNNWERYDKHDYAHFNPVHTWIEYINRLAGALTGIPVLLMFITAIWHGRKTKKWKIFWWSAIVLFFLGFEAYLGKLVVDGNLIPGHITMHMAGSVVLLIFLVAILRETAVAKTYLDLRKPTKWILWGLLGLSALQIFWGTQVREEVDILLKAATQRSLLIDLLPNIFKLHRSFSILVVLMHGLFFYKLYKAGVHNTWVTALAVLLVAEVLAGVTLSYCGMPAGMQPIHLFFSLVMITIQFHLILISGRAKIYVN